MLFLSVKSDSLTTIFMLLIRTIKDCGMRKEFVSNKQHLGLSVANRMNYQSETSFKTSFTLFGRKDWEEKGPRYRTQVMFHGSKA